MTNAFARNQSYDSLFHASPPTQDVPSPKMPLSQAYVSLSLRFYVFPMCLFFFLSFFLSFFLAFFSFVHVMIIVQIVAAHTFADPLTRYPLCVHANAMPCHASLALPCLASAVPVPTYVCALFPERWTNGGREWVGKERIGENSRRRGRGEEEIDRQQERMVVR
jgi:hypothetical protein